MCSASDLNTDIFAEFMQATATLGNQGVAEDYDFCKYNKVIDMGGGTGGLLKLILAICPQLKGTIYELPEVPILRAIVVLVLTPSKDR